MLRSCLAAAGIMMGGVANSSELFAAQQDKKERFAKLGKVNVAWIGMANRGRDVMKDFERTGLANIVAMCVSLCRSWVAFFVFIRK